MSHTLLTVGQAAEELRLHPKTVLRYIRDERLPATRVGKAYRIQLSDLHVFMGRSDHESGMLTTSITELSGMSAEAAERLATFLQSAALSSAECDTQRRVQTAFDPVGKTLKVVMIGAPLDVGKLLKMLTLYLGART